MDGEIGDLNYLIHDALVDALEDADADLRASKRLLGLCVEWLPQGFLCDTVRQVIEGRSAEEAWQALTEMCGGTR